MAPPTERLVFSTIIDSYLKGLGPLFTPQAHQELKAAGLDIDKPPPAIPAAEWLKYQDIFARHAWPHEQHTEQLRLLGRQMLVGWQNTVLGSATAGVFRVLGPHRTLPRLNRAIRTTNNFHESTTEQLGETEALVHVNDVQGRPSYWQGIFQGGLEVLKLEGTVVIDRQLPGPDATFRLTWK
jgi:uncharacterized protein (TIGR02265 family)